MPYYSSHPYGVTLTIKVTTKSSRTGPLKVFADQLTWGVNAPPVDGKANKFLVESISDFFKISKKSVEILKGATNKNKVVLMRDVTIDHLRSCMKKMSA